ncbi:hypothetical protein LCGC14_0531510 [marine sediment metagenome]|uniref:Uncharacterized protein n=1 Tax=marine sediment metagenome TaxID=412755 RepID=A0A0F9RVM3_9ZZZZ
MTRKKKKDKNLIKISRTVWIAMQYKKTLKKHKEEVKKEDE